MKDSDRMRCQLLLRTLQPSSRETIDFRASFAFLTKPTDSLVSTAPMKEQLPYHGRMAQRRGFFGRSAYVEFSAFRRCLQFERGIQWARWKVRSYNTGRSRTYTRVSGAARDNSIVNSPPDSARSVESQTM